MSALNSAPSPLPKIINSLLPGQLSAVVVKPSNTSERISKLNGWTKCHVYLAQSSALVLGSSPSCYSHLEWFWLSGGGNGSCKLAQEQFASLCLLPFHRTVHARKTRECEIALMLKIPAQADGGLATQGKGNSSSRGRRKPICTLALCKINTWNYFAESRAQQ